MRNVKKKSLLGSGLLLAIVSTPFAVAQQESVRSANLKAILSVGQEQKSALPTELLDGTYVVGPITGDEIKEESYLLVETDVNDSEKFYALMIPKPLPKDQPRGIAYLYHGRKLGGSGSLMLSPLTINIDGNLEIVSETRRDAPVLEVSSRAGRHKYPYIVQGKNGAFGGQILGMRGFGGHKPALKARPKDGVFVSGSKTADLVVSYPDISFFDGKSKGSSYTMLEMNGDEGQFALMLQNNLDTAAEQYSPGEQVKRIAVFASGGCFFDKEVLITLNPTIIAGEYQATLYRPASRTLWEIMFPGRRIPKNAQDQ